MEPRKRIRFGEIEAIVPPRPGIYEIHTDSGMSLKVGIATDLRSRLKQHRASRQSGLKLRSGGSWDNPSDVSSKKSVLAKHLFFDGAITDEYDLKREDGRRAFLAEKCHFMFMATLTREEARDREIELERTGRFRYTGTVVKR